jgi:zinc and cadmium transporter
MQEQSLYAIGSVVVVSLISLVGVLTIALSKKLLSKIVRFLVSFSAGALLGDAFLHLLPEVVEENGFTLSISLAILLGILIFFVLEKFVRWRHCHISDATTDEDDHKHPFVVMSLLGDSLHNFIDGIVIGASYLISIPVGIATTIAVAMHEIPQEIGDFGVLVHGGFSRKMALALNFLTALTALAGVFFILFLEGQAENAVPFFVALTAGGFIYIASADLIPELHKEVRVSRSLIELLAFVLGIVTMLLLLSVEFTI